MGSERRGAAGEGVGYLLWSPERGLCAGGGPHRADKKRFPRKAEIMDTPEKRDGCPYGGLTGEMAWKKGSIRTFAAWLQ